MYPSTKPTNTIEALDLLRKTTNVVSFVEDFFSSEETEISDKGRNSLSYILELAKVSLTDSIYIISSVKVKETENK